MNRLIAPAIIVLAASLAHAAPEYVLKDGFDKAIVGKVISSKNAKGKPFTATFKADGTGDFKQQGKKQARFKWTMDGNTVCWDFGDFKECNNVEIISPSAAKFYDAKTKKLNNTYSVK